MPTTHRHHQIIETPDVTHALHIAALQWPGESLSQLLLRLVHAGSETLEQRRSDAASRRVEAIDTGAGKYDCVFGQNYLAELRQDWPE